MTAQIHPRANTITVLLQWGDAAKKGVKKSGRSSQRPQSPWEGPGLPPAPSAHMVELPPTQKKKKSIWVSAIKNRHLLSMYVNCFKRGKDVQAWWLIFAFISKSIRLILKVQKSFLHIWFIMCSVSSVGNTFIITYCLTWASLLLGGTTRPLHSLSALSCTRDLHSSLIIMLN